VSQDDILALSNEEFSRIYLERLSKLRKEISSIEAYQKKKAKPLSNNQKAIYKMISGSAQSAIITVNDISIIFHIGNRKFGLKHILMRHYCDDCDGKVSAMDIISIERFLKKNLTFSENQNKYGYIYDKHVDGNVEKYKLLLFKDVNHDNVLSVYKIEAESGTGANSPVDKSTETSMGELILSEK
jgi:hypothetical protein